MLSITLTRRSLIGATALVASLAFGAAAMAQDVVLKLHQFLPAQATVPNEVLRPWMEAIEKDSGGRIKFEHYPAMQLGGKPNELYDQVVDGVADVVWTVPGYTPGRFPRTEVFELPFMMTNAEATSRAYWQLGSKTMLDTDFKDVKVLGLWVHGPGIIHSRVPVTAHTDLNGVKLRAPTRIINMMFSGLGATAVGMPVPAVPESLSKGVIDAAVIPWEVTRSLKTSELVKNHTEFPGASLYTTTFVLAMNKGAYDKLPDDLKAVVDKHSGLEFSAMAGRVMQDYDAPARKVAVDLGNNIISLTPEQIAEWQAAAAPTVDAWIADSAKAGFDGKAMVDEARALIAAETK